MKWVPFCAHEHVAAVDSNELHLEDRDAEEAREDLVAIRTNPIFSSSAKDFKKEVKDQLTNYPALQE